MLYKKLKDLKLIEVDEIGNVKILDEKKFQKYFKENYNEKWSFKGFN